jgi:hypothetical protein
MTGTESSRASVTIGWIARIIGLIILVFLLMILIGETVTSIQDETFKFDVESLYIIIPTVIALTAYILSWWHKTLGGSLLILVSITFGILPYISVRQHQESWSISQALQGWLILGLPFFIIGVLFLISAFLDRKTAYLNHP